MRKPSAGIAVPALRKNREGTGHPEVFRVHSQTKTGPPARHPHYNSLMFGRWSDDSKFIYAAEDGEEDHEGQRRSYREIYRIAASDVTIEDEQHCHQPLSDPKLEQLNWDHTPCAGTYK